MVSVVFGEGQVRLFPDKVFLEFIDHAFDHIQETNNFFVKNYLYFLLRIRDTLDQEPKKE